MQKQVKFDVIQSSGTQQAIELSDIAVRSGEDH